MASHMTDTALTYKQSNRLERMPEDTKVVGWHVSTTALTGPIIRDRDGRVSVITQGGYVRRAERTP